MKVNTKDFMKAMDNLRISGSELLALEGAGARIIVNRQRELVPVDTSATQNSIGSHIVEASEERVVDEVGPETMYAPVIEYGRADMPNYPIQPFIRPSVEPPEPVTNEIAVAFGDLVRSKAK